VSLLVVFLLPRFYWLGGSLFHSIHSLLGAVKGEVSYALSNPVKGCYIFASSIFIVVALYNFLALFPHVFSLTSHLLVTLPLSYTFWLGIIIFSWVSSLKNFLSHLIPAGTPLALISFMVMVEILRNLIRPLALTFRLTANIMAGHLLMSLIGGALIGLSLRFLVLGALVQSLLVFIELGVSIIQAYVFSTLLLLYLSEGEH